MFLLPTINPTTHATEISTLTSRGKVLRTETNERPTDASHPALHGRFALRVYHMVNLVFLPLPPKRASLSSLPPSASLCSQSHPPMRLTACYLSHILLA
jgi:hypothetical protein